MKILLAILRFVMAIYKQVVRKEVEDELNQQSKVIEDDFKRAEQDFLKSTEEDINRIGRTWDEFHRLHPSGKVDLKATAPHNDNS